MKKLMIATLAAATALSPAMTPAAMALTPRGDHDRYDRGDQGSGRDDRDDRGSGRYDRDDRRGDRDDRRDFRRDDRRHNGYWFNGRFYRGEPTRAQRVGRDFRYDYRQWRRGERLNTYERARYHRIANYRSYRLSAPPRGYEWRQSDTGEYILTAIATGVILSVILNASR